MNVYVCMYIRMYACIYVCMYVKCVPLTTKPGISLIILLLMRILQRNLKQTTDAFLFVSHTTNVLLFKFHCNIFIGVRIIKEMPDSVESGTHCMFYMRKKKEAKCNIEYIMRKIYCYC